MGIYKIVLADAAKRSLYKVPAYIVKKLQAWVDAVETEGLILTRRIPGYHDEPLKGKRVGQRSVRLNKSYRAIYVIDQEGKVCIPITLQDAIFNTPYCCEILTFFNRKSSK